MQVQLLFHGPAQVSLHEPGVTDYDTHFISGFTLLDQMKSTGNL